MAIAKHHIAVLAMGVALTVSACDGGETRAERQPDRSTSSTREPSGSANADVTDALESEPVDHMADTDGTVVRAGNGISILVSTNEFATRTTYRVYSPRWRPLTPVLELRGDLAIDRGLEDSFIGEFTVTRTSGRLSVDEPVTVSSNGSLTAVEDRASDRDRPVRIQPDDRRLTSLRSGRLVYRPATNAVYRTPKPTWDVFSRSWYRSASGGICALERNARLGATIHVSIDEGRTFTDISTRALPVNSGPTVQSCETAGDRIAVMTGGEYPQWVHVLDSGSGSLLVSHFVGDPNGPYNPYGWRLLPDGKLVFDTNRPGLYVATDTSNKILEFRPHPRLPQSTTVVIGDDLALLSGAQRLYVSANEGRTWSIVAL
jgi:hypothetical protein